MDFILITGASRGIGKAIARECASRGFSVLLTGRDEKLLETVAQEITQEFTVATDWMRSDLVDAKSPQKLFAWITKKKYKLQGLVNNAGFGMFGPFAESDEKNVQELVQVNCTACLTLTRTLLPLLQQNKQSFVQFVASTAAFQPLPYSAVYAASKSFILSFAQALRFELRDTGVLVSCLCPGVTKSDFFTHAKMPILEGTMMSAERVAKDAVTAMLKGTSVTIPGKRNAFAAMLSQIMPKSLVVQAIGTVFRKRLG